MQEREEKLLRLYESQQQRAFERVGRGSAGSNSSITSTATTAGGGKVRQMFDERRQKAGIDRSYPLEPINKTNKVNGIVNKTNGVKNRSSAVKSVVEKSMTQVKNGNVLLNKTAFKETVYNNNGGEETYREREFVKDDLRNNFIKSHNHDLVTMMNNHNLNDSLDDEVLPSFDEPDEPLFRGKLANLGGKLPSENGLSKPSVPYTFTTTKTPAVKKETKVCVKN